MSVTLLPYQVPAADALEAALRKHRVALDLSQCGTGKTVVACEVLKRMGRSKNVVVCPKVVVPTWRRWAREFGIEVDAFTYEKMRLGNTGLGHWERKKFVWDLPADAVIVFDEAHRVGGQNTQNSRMARDSKSFDKLLLSATLAESPLQMRAIAHLTHMAPWGDWYGWCLRNGCARQHWGGLVFPAWPAGRGLTADQKEAKQAEERKRILSELHHYLLPDYGCCVRIADLGDAFPDGVVTADAYDLGNEAEILAAYERMREEMAVATSEMEREAAATNALQIIELAKVPALVDMTKELIEQGMSVVIVTNFRASLEAYKLALGCGGVYGGQSETERSAVVDTFQANDSHCIIVNIQAGGVGLSLHDLHGARQRIMLINPTFSSKNFRQCLFRTRRQGSQSAAIAKIIFAANTPEEEVCERVAEKLQNIDLLNDGDLEIIKRKDLPKETPRLSSPPMNDQTLCPTTNLPPTPPASPEPSPAATEKSVDTTSSKTNSTKKRSPKACSEPTCGQPTTAQATETAPVQAAHAVHGPSSLKYKWECPGWQNTQSNEPNPWAERGTRGHAAVEVMSSEGLSDDPNLKEAVEMCIDYVRSTLNSLCCKAQVFREVRIPVLDQFGSADLVAIAENGEAHLMDWKFAKNLYKANSPQFWAYSLGIFDKWPVDSIKVHVLHPWLNTISTETFTRKDDYTRLLAAVRLTIAQAEEANPDTFNINSGCVYCARASRCTKLAATAATLANRYDPTLPTLPEGSLHGSETRDPEVLARLLDLAPIIEKAVSGWKKAALELWQHDGVPIPGYKLSERNGSRKITAPAVAFDLFIEKGGSAADYARVAEVPIGDLEDLFASLAPKGKKGAAKQELNDLLVDRDALTVGSSSWFLSKVK